MYLPRVPKINTVSPRPSLRPLGPKTPKTGDVGVSVDLDPLSFHGLAMSLAERCTPLSSRSGFFRRERTNPGKSSEFQLSKWVTRLDIL